MTDPQAPWPQLPDPRSAPSQHGAVPASGYPQQGGAPAPGYPQQGWSGAPNPQYPQGGPGFAAPGRQAPYVYGQPVASPSAPQGAYGPTGYEGGAGMPPLPPGPVPARRKRRGMWIAIAVVAALVLGGGGWGAYALFTAFRGSASPEAAVERYISAMTEMDPVQLALSMAPSEAGLIRPFGEDLLKTPLRDAKSPTIGDILDRLRGAVSVSRDGLEYETTEITEGISQVRIVAGSITFDGDEGKIRDIVRELVDGLVYNAALIAGESESEATSRAADAASEVNGDFSWPLTMTFDRSGMQGESMSQPSSVAQMSSFTTVDENGWYVSGMLSTVSSIAVGMSGSDVLGGEPFAAAGAATPEEAGMQLVNGLRKLDTNSGLEQIAGVLPLAERRVLGVFRDLISKADLTVSATSVSGGFTSSVSDGVTTIHPDKLRIEYDGDSVEFDGTCISQTRAGYRSSSPRTETYCLKDVPQFETLGLTDIGIVTVEEGGRWYVSLIATGAHFMQVALDNYVSLRDQGRLAELQG